MTPENVRYLFILPILVSIVVVYGLATRHREAWALGAVNLVFWAVLNFVTLRTEIGIANIVFIPLYLYGWYAWGPKKRPPGERS